MKKIKKHCKHKVKANNKILIFRIISFIIILVCIYFIITWQNENEHNDLLIQNLIVTTNIENIISSNNSNTESNTEKENIDFTPLLEVNSETVAWLTVSNTNINYSVVRSKNNSYYLNHSFDYSYNAAGWIFADYRNKFDDTDKNIVIYGHNRKDGSMFGSLKNALTEDWYLNEENRIITLYTPTAIYNYRIFSVYNITADDSMNQINFKSSNAFRAYLKAAKQHSIYDFNVEINESDSILTLITCGNTNSTRTVMHAKKENI